MILEIDLPKSVVRKITREKLIYRKVSYRCVPTQLSEEHKFQSMGWYGWGVSLHLPHSSHLAPFGDHMYGSLK